MKKNLLSAAVKGALGLTAAAVMVPAMPAFAQEDASLVEEVVVTGSRITRSDANSASPITVLGEMELEASGQATLEDFLQNLPSVGGGDFGSSVNNGNPGIATASLRGLGPNRTLVLMNGRRLPSVGSGGIVDLNTIPTSIIERVEVLRDGASTIYGSDAVAGVINIITKKDFNGAELDTQYDISGQGDGESYSYAFTVGNSFDKGNMLFNLQYTRRDEIMQGDRGFSDCPLFESDGQKLCGGSGTTSPGQFFNDNYTGHVLDPQEGVREFDAARDAYNYAATSYMVTPQEIYSVYGSADYMLVEESGFGSVKAFAEANFSNRQSDQLMAPVGTFWGPTMTADHPDNPVGEDIAVARRLTETGGRNFTQNADVWRMVMGLEGELANGWRWDASYNYGTWTDTRVIFGQLNQPRIETLLDPAKCADESACPGLWNPLIADSLTPEMQEYALVTHSPVSESTIRSFQANLSGDFGGFALTDEPLQWAVGIEKRSEDALFQPDGAAVLGQIYFVSGEKTEGSYNVDEAYAEIRVPLLAGLPGVESLALQASARSSEYSFTDRDTVTNVGIEYAPIEDVRLRATYNEGFRAPNIGELFSPQNLTAAAYTDPCRNWGSNGNAIIRANCQADGLPSNLELSSTQATGLNGGNPNLTPEQSETTTFGIVLTPSALEGLTATIDYFKIDIEEAVGTAGTNAIINNCYESPNFSSPFCELITGPGAVGAAPHPTSPRRDALNTISGQLLTNANLATFSTEGIDFSIAYNFDIGQGNLNLSAMGTYLMKYNYLALEGEPVTELAGKFGTDPYQGDSFSAFPELKTNITAAYTMDNWGLSWTARYMSEVEDLDASDANLVNKADAIVYHDAQGFVEWNDFTFSLGVRNLLDEEPPYVTNYDDMNTIHYNYDTAGRYFYSKASLKF